MSKILLSFVGTGTVLDTESKIKQLREYRTAEYHLGDEALGKYPFVAAAIAQHHDIDKVILIGTAHSMWEEVYRYFCERKGMECNEDAYWEISEYCEHAKSDSPLTIPHQEKIEQALGGDSHIMLIRYGLNEEEITENLGIVLSLDKYVNTGDEIIVDVTHSFRSLPIVVMNLVTYLTNVSKKSPKISHVYYGMLEMAKELQYAPIVDIKKVLELNKWIAAASAFQSYGNAYQVVELLKDVDPDSASRLKDFSDVLNLNYLYNIEKSIVKVKALKNASFDSPLTTLTVKPVIDNFLKECGTTDDNHALFQYKLALWHYHKKNFALSLISLFESIVTWACIKKGVDWNDKTSRESIKSKIENIIPKDLYTSYEDIRIFRNSAAHSKKTKIYRWIDRKRNKRKWIEVSPAQMIDMLREALELTGKCIFQQL